MSNTSPLTDAISKRAEAIRCELVECTKREAQLREALKYARRFLNKQEHDTGFVDLALSQAAPPVVPLADVKPLLDALWNSEHARDCEWHTGLMHPPGPCTCGRDSALAAFTAKYPQP